MTPQVKIYNSLSRKKEALQPINKNWVGLYTCGPTVYNYAHIGNLRTYIFEDILQRTLEYSGHKVKRVMNITDVGHLTSDADEGEDKLDREAQKSRKSPQEIAEYYTNAFFRDLEKLNIKKPKIIAPATEYIKEQQELIAKLFEKGLAYETETAIYFDVKKYGREKYLRLSRQPLNEKLVGAREDVVVDKDKRNPADFVLWFKLVGKFKNHVLRWPSPWGDGFPGWHIECSAISTKFLGQPFDIHTGGVDLIGTHHTNEIAQSEGASGRPLAKIWMHGEFLLVDKSKMAKSEGNFFTIADIEKKGFRPLAFRYLVLQAHYRTPLNFSWESLQAAQSGLDNLYTLVLEARDEARKENRSKNHAEGLIWKERFDEAMGDDLNTAKALSVTFEMLQDKTLQARIKRGLIDIFDQILGLRVAQTMAQASPITQEIREKLKRYGEFRASKQFMQSDALRKEMEDLGYSVRDTGDGSVIVKKFR